jgi:rhodanese-related sulfurtransferase
VSRSPVETTRSPFDEIHPEELESWRARGASIVDVREAWEYRQGHVPGARNIPLGSLVGRLDELTFPLVLVCATGNRSGMAARSLSEGGHAGVANLLGGTEAWRERGFPLARP